MVSSIAQKSDKLADDNFRCHLELRGWICCLQLFVQQHFALCSRGSMVRWEMGTSRASSRVIACSREVHVPRLQCRHRTRTTCFAP